MRRIGKMLPVIAAASAAILTLTVTACANGGGGPAAAQAPAGVEKPNLTVAVVPAVDSAGFFIALHDGLFKDQGLNVNFVPAISSETEIADQVKGTVDISGGNYVSYIQAEQAGQANLDIFAEGSVMQPGAQGLYTMPDSPIKTLNQLEGKTVGINAPKNILYLLVASVLAEHNIPVNSVHFASYALPAMAAALKAGKIQAAVLPEPFASQAAQQFGVVSLADLNQGATASFPIQGYVVTKQWAAQYPRTLAAFNAALQEGQKIADTDRATLEQAMEHVPDGLGVNKETAAIMAIDVYPVGGVDNVRLQRVADVMSQFLGFPAFNVKSMIGG
ncbi:MAG TPA: ABC transporter substrate-binding protein [Streptosporangiaceae bacterium]